MANLCNNPNSLYYPTVALNSAVTVNWVDGTYTNLSVNWNPVAGAAGYNVYGAPTPTTRNKLNTAPVTGITYPYTAPQAPTDTVWHFWVSAIDALGNETFINPTDAATLYTRTDYFDPTATPQTTAYGQNMINEDAMQFYLNEIRRRSQVILENDGEDFDVYLRRWTGKPCPHEDARVSDDPDMNSLTKCQYCFGAGVLGGFYHKLRLKIRYGDIPNRYVRFNMEGMTSSLDFNAWTLWSPRLKEHDLVVRRLTGESFIVKEVGESAWRGMITQQRMHLVLLQPSDIRHTVTDAAIDSAVTIGGALPFEQPRIWG